MNPFRTSKSWHEFLASLYLHDALCVLFIQGMTIIALIVSWRLEYWGVLVALNTICSVAILVIAVMDHRTHNIILDSIHRYYITVMVFAIFKEIYLLVPAVNPALYDNILIQIDHAMFGVHPTQWLVQFSTPVTVEFFQICYSLFYVIMLGLAIEMSLRGRDEDYERYVSTIVCAFFLSYIGYLLVPAIGPRFTLHDFMTLDTELRGLWFTDTLRIWINSGESIREHATNFLDTAQRDAFPSGHTEMTLVTIIYVWRLRAHVRWVVTFIGVGLIIGTVFLRYHYVIDVIGGIVFFLLTMWSFPSIERWWQRLQRFAASPVSRR